MIGVRWVAGEQKECKEKELYQIKEARGRAMSTCIYSVIHIVQHSIRKQVNSKSKWILREMMNEIISIEFVRHFANDRKFPSNTTSKSLNHISYF